MTTDQDRKLLLRLARAAIAAHVTRSVDPQSALRTPESAVRTPESAMLSCLRGAFVSLHNRGDLRGCIGHIEANQLLGDVVARCAVAACSADPRFPPIAHIELAEIDIEISLLGPLEPITGPEDLVVGRHGLLVERGRQRGLLLPQVATEWHWNADAFLAHTCEKAGLPRDAWKKGATVWRFEAEVFGER